MPITFQKVEVWVGSRDIVTFPAEVNQKRISCAISWEALQDHFGGNSVPPLDVFRANRQAIEAKAVQIINRQRFELDGSILIRTSDC